MALVYTPAPLPASVNAPQRRLPLTGSGTAGRVRLRVQLPQYSPAKGCGGSPVPLHPSPVGAGAGSWGVLPALPPPARRHGRGTPTGSCVGNRAGDTAGGASSREWHGMAKAPSCPHAGAVVPRTLPTSLPRWGQPGTARCPSIASTAPSPHPAASQCSPRSRFVTGSRAGSPGAGAGRRGAGAKPLCCADDSRGRAGAPG